MRNVILFIIKPSGSRFIDFIDFFDELTLPQYFFDEIEIKIKIRKEEFRKDKKLFARI